MSACGSHVAHSSATLLPSLIPHIGASLPHKAGSYAAAPRCVGHPGGTAGCYLSIVLWRGMGM
jgi:hypothetical protein